MSDLIITESDPLQMMYQRVSFTSAQKRIGKARLFLKCKCVFITFEQFKSESSGDGRKIV